MESPHDSSVSSLQDSDDLATLMASSLHDFWFLISTNGPSDDEVSVHRTELSITADVDVVVIFNAKSSVPILVDPDAPNDERGEFEE